MEHKPGHWREAGFVIVITYVMMVIFQSEAIDTWLQKQALNHPELGPIKAAVKSWHETMDRFALNQFSRRSHNLFTAAVPLRQNFDAIGFHNKEGQSSELNLTGAAFLRQLNLSLTNLVPLEATATAKEAPPPVAAATKHYPRILVIGDSVMGGIAPMLKKELRDRGITEEPIISWKISTGLARSDYYNWPKVVSHLLTTNKVDLVVALFGTNDALNAVWHDGHFVARTDKDWEKIYQLKVEEMQSILCLNTQHVYWLELPPMREEKFNRETAKLNLIFKTAAQNHPCIHFTATQPILGDDKGDFATYRKIDGDSLKIREGDGVHLTNLGGQLMAQYLLNQIYLDMDRKAH